MKQLGIFCLALILVSLVFFAGCSRTRLRAAPNGLILALNNGPLSGERLVQGRKGRSSSYALLGLVAFGDASLKGAMEAGGIKSLHASDYEYVRINLLWTPFVIWEQYTAVVYGE